MQLMEEQFNEIQDWLPKLRGNVRWGRRRRCSSVCAIGGLVASDTELADAGPHLAEGACGWDGQSKKTVRKVSAARAGS